MRMLHIRNMHQLASAAISPLHEDSPARPRLVGSRKPGADHLVARLPPVFCPTCTTPTTCHYHQLPSGTHLSLALRSACQLDRGSVPTDVTAKPAYFVPTFQNTKRPLVRRLVKAFSPSCTSLSPLLRNRSAASAVEMDPSKIHPIGENFPLRRSADYIRRPLRLDFPRASSDLLQYVHRPHSPPTLALMRAQPLHRLM
jgi:hypothetical protein